jgi:hypothetical protein
MARLSSISRRRRAMRMPPARLASESASPPGLAGVDGLGSAQLRCGRATRWRAPTRAGQMAQHLGAHRVGVAVGQGQVGVVALHLGLPVAFQGRQNLLQLGAAHCFLGHVFLLALFFEDNGNAPPDAAKLRRPATELLPFAMVARIVLCAAKPATSGRAGTGLRKPSSRRPGLQA